MRALIASPHGDPPVAVADVDEPRLDDGECLIEVRAAALNRGELRLVEARPGWGPGQDVAGVVVRPSADGGPAAGARVAAVIDQGGWAERAAVPIARACELPDAVSFEEGATLGVAGLTALRALRLGGSLLGRRVLVTGASGGVGRFAVQLAHAGGAHVTAVVGAPERADGLEQLGADRIVLDAEEHDDTVDLVLDGVCGPALERAVRALGPGGLAVTYGMASQEPARIGLFDFDRGEGASLRPFRLYRTDVNTFGADLGFLAGEIERGRLTAPIGMRVPWSELPSAMDALRDRRVLGKVVIVPDVDGPDASSGDGSRA